MIVYIYDKKGNGNAVAEVINSKLTKTRVYNDKNLYGVLARKINKMPVFEKYISRRNVVFTGYPISFVIDKNLLISRAHRKDVKYIEKMLTDKIISSKDEEMDFIISPTDVLNDLNTYQKNKLKKKIGLIKKVSSITLGTVILVNAISYKVPAKVLNFIKDNGIYLDVEAVENELENNKISENEKYAIVIPGQEESTNIKLDDKIIEENNLLDKDTINPSCDNFIEENIEKNVNDYVNLCYESFLNSEEGNYLVEQANVYNVPYNLVLSIALSESSLDHYSVILGGSDYNGFAYGLMQLESPGNWSVSAYNTVTNQIDEEIVTIEKANDIKSNIRIGTMKIRTLLDKYNNNVMLASQAYNFGEGGVDLILAKMRENSGFEKKEFYQKFDANIFLEECKSLSKNPKAYTDTLSNEIKEKNGGTIKSISSYSRYGSGNYCEKVVKNCIGTSNELINISGNNTLKR